MRAGFGPVCGRVEIVVGFPGVFGGRGGNELSYWSDSLHICLPHVQSRPSWPRFAAMNRLILLSFSARLPPGGSLKIVRNSSSSISLKLPMVDGGKEKRIFCGSKRIGKITGHCSHVQNFGRPNEVKTETMLYAERFEIDDWEDLTKFLK